MDPTSQKYQAKLPTKQGQQVQSGRQQQQQTGQKQVKTSIPLVKQTQGLFY